KGPPEFRQGQRDSRQSKINCARRGLASRRFECSADFLASRGGQNRQVGDLTHMWVRSPTDLTVHGVSDSVNRVSFRFLHVGTSAPTLRYSLIFGRAIRRLITH